MSAATTPILVFPGLDGTGQLLEEFKAEHPPGLSVKVLPLPQLADATYEKLVDHFADQVEAHPGAIVIGESFSGPLAVLLGQRCPSVRGVILAASFATAPVPRVARRVPWDIIAKAPQPAFALKRVVMSGDDSPELVTAVQRSLGSVPPPALAARVRALSAVDVREQLAGLKVPVMALNAARDQLIPERCRKAIVAARPDTVVRSIDAPHLMLQTEPKQAWEHIAAFAT